MFNCRSPIVSGGIEKVTGDGQEGEEAPVTSPPLELRRPGSVGLALTSSRSGGSVGHGLQSPHDRATGTHTCLINFLSQQENKTKTKNKHTLLTLSYIIDSPQVGQVYGLGSRLPHYHPPRYYEHSSEPPPAHRPLTSHSSLAALGNERSLSHMLPLGTPDRPLSTHSALPPGHMSNLGNPDRSLTSHLNDRAPLGGLTIGAGLGAAGNLMGAVARHIGADAPASQRGLQAATPPHASQVPPQAESLLMLLKVFLFFRLTSSCGKSDEYF